MIKYTIASIELIIADLKRYYRVFKWLSFLIMFSYFVFASIVGIGIRWVNISLASIMLVYQIIDSFALSRNTRKYLRRSYKWVRLIIKAVSLGFLVYGIYEAASNADPLNIILATLMIIFWVAQVMFEILLEIFEDKKDLLIAAIKEDFSEAKGVVQKPINTVKKVVNFFKGKPVDEGIYEEESEESKEIKRLKKYMQNKKKDY